MADAAKAVDGTMGDNIVYISNGEIKASCSRTDFMADLGRPGETLEEIFLKST